MRPEPVSGPSLDRGFGLYIHWPFCRSKCPYCDFNSHVAADIDHDRFAAAFRREMAYGSAIWHRTAASSLFFGGGTPSLMPPALVAG